MLRLVLPAGLLPLTRRPLHLLHLLLLLHHARLDGRHARLLWSYLLLLLHQRHGHCLLLLGLGWWLLLLRLLEDNPI